MIIFGTCDDWDKPVLRTMNARLSWEMTGQTVSLYDRSDVAIKHSRSGAMVLPSLFKYVEDTFGPAETYAYVNSDIILMNDFVEAVKAIEEKFDSFLMVGRRWNWNRVRRIYRLDLNESKLAFVDEVKDYGKLFNAASDYFVFRGDQFFYDDWPDLYIGRYWWDPWLMWFAMNSDIPVIDVTKAVFAIHQHHDPGHRSWDLEGQHNEELAKEAIKAGVDLDSVPYEMTKDLRVVKRDGL